MRVFDLFQYITYIWERFKKLTVTIRKKDETIKKLSEALDLKGNMKCEHSAYWLKDDQGNTIDGPFCTNCFDNEHTTRRLVQGGKPNSGVGHNWEWVQCPECKLPFRQEKVGVYLNTH